MHWFRVDNTLPRGIKFALLQALKSCDMVLLFREQTGVGVLYMDEERRGFYFFPDSIEFDDCFFKNVTHWMPISKPAEA